MSVFFFHQNEVGDAQGGIERYLATLLQVGGSEATLVTEDVGQSANQRIRVRLPLAGKLPKWLSYLIGLFLALPKIRARLKGERTLTLELSRPEYALFAWLLPGAKVVTIHGTGPAAGERGKYLIHHAACLLLPFVVDVVQVVGRDPRGLSDWVRRRMRDRIVFIDAWYDDCFRSTPMPSIDGPMQIFYAGRLAPMKNPELLFGIIRAAAKLTTPRFEFHYFGADSAAIPADIRPLLQDHGMQPAAKLAQAIARCHCGILCSAYGEGSPFIVIETLACGRCYVLSPLPGLKSAYSGHTGVAFAEALTADAFIAQLTELWRQIQGGLTAEAVSDQVASRSKSVAARHILDSLAEYAAGRASGRSVPAAK